MTFGPSERETRDRVERALYQGRTDDPEARRRLFAATGYDFSAPAGHDPVDAVGVLALAGAGLLAAFVAGPSAMAYRSLLRPGSAALPWNHPGFPFFLVAWWGGAWVIARRASPPLAFVLVGTGLGLGVLTDVGPAWIALVLWVQLAGLCRVAARARARGRGGFLRGLRDLTLGGFAGVLLLGMTTEPRSRDARGVAGELAAGACDALATRYPARARRVDTRLGLPAGATAPVLPVALALAWLAIGSRARARGGT